MRTLGARTSVNTAKFLVLLAVVLFVSAGSFRFAGAWIYLGLNLVWLTVCGLYFLEKDPALVERRLLQEEQGEKEPVQRLIMTILRVLGLITLVIAGLDHRFAWSVVPVWVVATAVVVFVLGAALVFGVFAENTYTSSIIEVAPAQRVVVTGPYRFLRHPMYTGVVLMGLAMPLILGSYWALAMVPPGWVLLVLRILAEERFLSRELEGYAEYMRRTPKRLIPGVW